MQIARGTIMATAVVMLPIVQGIMRVVTVAAMLTAQDTTGITAIKGEMEWGMVHAHVEAVA
jgi:hypothetical protein